MNREKNYKLVIFDVDGTMLDTSEGLLASTIYTINKLGYPIPEKSVLESFVGPRIQDSLSRVYGLKGESLNIAVNIFREHYRKSDVFRARPYEGIYEILEILKQQGIHIAVATNKRQDFVEMLMKKYKFESYIEIICGTDFDGKLKKADLLYMCMEKLQITEKENVVLIGDSAYDAEAAECVGIDFIGVLYGFDFKSKDDVKKWKSVDSIFNLMELKHILIK